MVLSHSLFFPHILVTSIMLPPKRLELFSNLIIWVPTFQSHLFFDELFAFFSPLGMNVWVPFYGWKKTIVPYSSQVDVVFKCLNAFNLYDWGSHKESTNSNKLCGCSNGAAIFQSVTPISYMNFYSRYWMANHRKWDAIERTTTTILMDSLIM